jgi:hypothetical protein
MNIWKSLVCCMLTVLNLVAKFAAIKPLFDSRPTPPLIFWALKMHDGLIVFTSTSSTHVYTPSCTSTRSCWYIYRSLWELLSQLSGFSRILSGQNTYVIFTQDVHRETLGFYYVNIFLENSKIGQSGSPRTRIPEGTIVTKKSKIFLVSLSNGWIWPTLRLLNLV